MKEDFSLFSILLWIATSGGIFAGCFTPSIIKPMVIIIFGIVFMGCIITFAIKFAYLQGRLNNDRRKMGRSKRRI
jgi:hypothetical protein